MFDINRFLYKLRDRSMYTSIFKSKSKRETYATVMWIFEGGNRVFVRVSRALSRSTEVFLCKRLSNKEVGGRQKLID
jgi:hypothetical protein